MRTAQRVAFGKAVFSGGKVGTADFAFELSGFTVIAVKIRLWGATGRAGAVFGNIAFLTAGNWLNLHVVALFKVREKELPVPFMLYDLDFWEFIHFEFLVFRGMGIIKGPLLKRNVSADEVDQPAVLLIKVLN